MVTNLQKKKHYPPKEVVLCGVILAPFFEDMKHSDKLSEIKPPLGFLTKLQGSDFSRRVSIHEESSTKFYVYSQPECRGLSTM